METKKTGKSAFGKFMLTVIQLNDLFFYWTFFPLLIIVTPWVVFQLTEDPISAIIGIAVEIALFLIIRKYSYPKNGSDYEHTMPEDNLRAVITVIVGVFTMCLLTLKLQNIPRNPWPTWSWIFYGGSAILVGIYIFLFVKTRHNQRENKIVFILWGISAVIAFGFIYLYWGRTQWVSVPIYGTFLMFLIHYNPELENENYWGDNLPPKAAFVAVVVDCLSVICQYWYSVLFWKIELWHLLGIVAFTAASIIVWVKYTEFKAKKQEERLELQREEAEKKLEAEKREAEEKEKETLLQEAQLRCLELIKVIQESEVPDWKDILAVCDKVQEHNLGIEFKVNREYAAKASLKNFIQVSEVKKQLFWNKDELSRILTLLEVILKKSFNDAILEKIVERILELRILEGYKGYEALVKQLSSFEEIKKYFEEKKQ